MSSYKNKLRKAFWDDSSCPKCGLGGPESPTCDLIWPDDEDREEHFEETQYCELCGRPWHIVLSWDD